VVARHSEWKVAALITCLRSGRLASCCRFKCSAAAFSAALSHVGTPQDPAKVPAAAFVAAAFRPALFAGPATLAGRAPCSRLTVNDAARLPHNTPTQIATPASPCAMCASRESICGTQRIPLAQPTPAPALQDSVWGLVLHMSGHRVTQDLANTKVGNDFAAYFIPTRAKGVPNW
jgi:hypothetical protein